MFNSSREVVVYEVTMWGYPRDNSYLIMTRGSRRTASILFRHAVGPAVSYGG
jgi:hypothetical protein